MNYKMDAPSDKQLQFFRSRTRFTAYGGARGGGKSWAVRKKAALMALRFDGIRIIVLRRTYPEIRENHILPLIADLKGIATYRDSDKSFTFPNGSRIMFGYCDSEADVMRYQGQEYDVIFLDEATQFTEWQFRVLTASLRGANDNPKRFYLTCNPGGVGHAWVKRLFVDRRYEPDENADDYSFIQATVKDNPVLLEKDPDYIRMLQALPEDKRRAWLDGDWSVMEGQFFPEFSERIHVCQPFEIPKHWNRYFGMDYGLDMFAGYWGAMSEDGHLYIYREVFQSGVIISDAAQMIHRMTGRENVLAYYAPPDVWGRAKMLGRDLPEIMGDYGVYPTQVSNNRVQGWLDMKEWLAVKEDGKPRLHIFAGRCPNLIQSIPYLQHSRRDPNDCDTEPHQYTHAPDALRYLIEGRPTRSAPAIDYDEEMELYSDNAQVLSLLEYGG